MVSVLRLSEAHASLEASTRNDRFCERLASDIQQLRRMGSIAEEKQTASDLGNSRLVRLATECGMAENQVTSIRRLLPLAIDGTDYQRQDVSIELQSVTMQQLVTMAIKAEDLRGSAKVTSMNLTSVRPTSRAAVLNSRDESGELWNAELILTRLVFVARSATR